MDTRKNIQQELNQPNFEVEVSPQFSSWMDEHNVSLGFTTYQAGKVFMLGLNANHDISVSERTFSQCMGMCVVESTMYLSTLYQLWRFDNIIPKGEFHGNFDRLYVPQLAFTTGNLDIHDVCINKTGKPIFVNTLFNCLATPSVKCSFKPIWKPPFISNLVPEDRCHLNGLAMKNGEPRFVTMVSQTDVLDGWRKHRRDGGTVMDIKNNAILADGLSMPHSPRWHKEKLYILNSGTGELGFINRARHCFEPIAFCPGYARGLAFHSDFAVLGLSKKRGNKAFTGLQLDERLQDKGFTDSCGIVIVDLQRGDIVHSLTIKGSVVEEIYDVCIIPNVRNPSLVGTRTDEIQRYFTIEE